MQQQPEAVEPHDGIREEIVREIQQQPHILLRLAENSLTVADSLRDNYFRNTASFVGDLRRAMHAAERGKREASPLETFAADTLTWEDVRDEVVTFIDGGVGQVQLAGQVPILLRVGSYAVRTGERDLAKREQFGYYPMILGDIEGGSKDRRDFIDIVRITAELLAALSALERTPDLRVLMLHGPLVYKMGPYAGHAPFTERDVDLFLHHYAGEPEAATELKEAFYREAEIDLYPAMLDYPDIWSQRRLAEPLTWLAFLYRRLIKRASERDPVPLIVGVVERGHSREFIETVILERVFRGLRERGNRDYFNQKFGRTDLRTPRTLIDRLGYSDELLLGMLMQPGQYSEPWEIEKYNGLRSTRVPSPDESRSDEVDFSMLDPSRPFGYPLVQATYVHVSRTTDPIRVEVFPALGDEQIHNAAQRTNLYARLLPGYGFPVGLDIADRYARVPAWLTDAYGKLIRQHLSASLVTGQISDQQMRRILVQAIYMTHRDWLFRPDG